MHANQVWRMNTNAYGNWEIFDAIQFIYVDSQTKMCPKNSQHKQTRTHHTHILGTAEDLRVNLSIWMFVYFFNVIRCLVFRNSHATTKLISVLNHVLRDER